MKTQMRKPVSEKTHYAEPKHVRSRQSTEYVGRGLVMNAETD